MAYPLRDRDPTIFRLITIRTEEARLWMVPNKEVRKLIGGIVARYQEIFKIEIYAIIVLSNHPHMLIRALESNADEFCENVNREIARRINWRNNRQGRFWSRRYDDQKILSEDDMLEAFLYVTTNAVRHGLEKHPSLWRGLNSYNQSIKEKSERFIFHHYSAGIGKPQVTEHTLKISPLPAYASQPQKKRMRLIRDLIEKRTAALVKERIDSGQGFLGTEKIQAQDPFSRPENISRRPRPPGYSKNRELSREYKKHLSIVRTQYTEASMQYRLGDMSVLFPKYTFRPPLHRKPRIFRFEPLPENYFKKVA